MTLTEEQIKSFQEMYKRYFGIEITKEQALESGLQLLNLFETIYTPITHTNYTRIEAHRLKTISGIFNKFPLQF